MMAIYMATGQLLALLARLQRHGAACPTIPGRGRTATRIVFHCLSGDALGAVTAQWEGAPPFAVMTLGEYVGQELSPCPLIVKCYAQKAQRARTAPHMW